MTARLAAPLAEIIRTLEPAQLDAKTPCTDYDVRALLNHLLFWGPSLVGAAHKESVPPPEPGTELITGEWKAAFTAHLDRVVAGWGEPAAWKGVTYLGGPAELPASLVGGMVLVELAVHGWDLARATGRSLTPDEDVAECLYEEVLKTAAQGRETGSYGPEAVVPDSAPVWARTLGLTGRDPAWTP